MERRELLAGGIGIVAGAVGGYVVGSQKEPEVVEKIVEVEKEVVVEAPAPIKAVKEFKMVTTWPRDFPGLGTGAQRLAQRISDLSDGSIKVEYFAAGERVGAFDSSMRSHRAMPKRTMPRTTTGRASIRVGPISPRCRSV